MSYEHIGQQGINESTPGAAGLYSLRDSDMGSSSGDAVDSTYSKNDVKQINFQRMMNLRGTGSTFFYTYGKNSQQAY